VHKKRTTFQLNWGGKSLPDVALAKLLLPALITAYDYKVPQYYEATILERNGADE
jgi:hypothetical protein